MVTASRRLKDHSTVVTQLNHPKWYKNKNMVQLLSMCAIPMLLLLVFNYIPMGGLVIAFKDYRFDLGIFGSQWVGMKNFEFLIASNDFVRITRNTLLLNALFISTSTVGAVIAALLLYEITNRLCIKVYQTILIIPYFLSWVIVGYMTYALLNPQYGFINVIIRSFGGEGIDWYSEPGYWPAILAIANLWKSMGINCITFYAGMMGIDRSYYEAAEVDGANRFQATWHITLPSIRPLIIIMTILAIGNIFRADFGLFYQLTRDVGKLYSTTDVIDTYIYRTMKIGTNGLTMSAAAGFLQSVVGFVMILLTNYIVNRLDSDCALF